MNTPPLTQIKQPRAALVDDSGIARRIARRVLTTHHVWDTLWEAEDGVEALALSELGAHDLMLLDIDMPRMDGLQTLEQMQLKGNMPYTVVISCMSDATTVQKAVGLGVKDYIVKPYDQATLIAKVDKYLKTRNRESV